MNGKKLMEARLARGLTRPQIAKMIGMEYSAIFRYEKGQRDHKLEMMERLLRAYGYKIVKDDREWSDYEEQ